MKINTKTIHEVWYGDFENFVKEYYGQEISIPARYELGQNSVFKADTDNRYAFEDSEKFSRWAAGEVVEPEYGYGNYEPSPGEILKDLHSKGLIPEGEYYIDIWW